MCEVNMNLYIVLLGGKHEKANIEVHDVIPVIGAELESTYLFLKQQWFGLEKGLHIDGWMQINGVSYQQQNYRIDIQDHPQIQQPLKLYLINLGAYLPTQFGEIHKYVVVAGIDAADAKVQAKLAIEQSWFKPHTDAIIDVDDCLELAILGRQYLHLILDEFVENTFCNDYILI